METARLRQTHTHTESQYLWKHNGGKSAALLTVPRTLYNDYFGERRETGGKELVIGLWMWRRGNEPERGAHVKLRAREAAVSNEPGMLRPGRGPILSGTRRVKKHQLLGADE